MATFRRRPEIVDGRQFTGGLQNGTDLTYWIQSNQGRASWHEAEAVGRRTLSERLRLWVPESHYTIVWVGDWIIRRQDGTWEVKRPEDLHEEYEEV